MCWRGSHASSAGSSSHRSEGRRRPSDRLPSLPNERPISGRRTRSAAVGVLGGMPRIDHNSTSQSRRSKKGHELTETLQVGTLRFQLLNKLGAGRDCRAPPSSARDHRGSTSRRASRPLQPRVRRPRRLTLTKVPAGTAPTPESPARRVPGRGRRGQEVQELPGIQSIEVGLPWECRVHGGHSRRLEVSVVNGEGKVECGALAAALLEDDHTSDSSCT